MPSDVRLVKESIVIRICALALVATLAAAGAAFAATAPPSVKITLDPQPGSKIAGVATITHSATEPPVVNVTIVLDGVFIPENEYPSGVYHSTCAKLATTPEYLLKPVIGGKSVTRVKPTPMKPGPYVIAVLNTAGTRAISCGALPAMHHAR
jgi:hypothetical protein